MEDWTSSWSQLLFSVVRYWMGLLFIYSFIHACIPPTANKLFRLLNLPDINASRIHIILLYSRCQQQFDCWCLTHETTQPGHSDLCHSFYLLTDNILPIEHTKSWHQMEWQHLAIAININSPICRNCHEHTLAKKLSGLKNANGSRYTYIRIEQNMYFMHDKSTDVIQLAR